MINATICGNLGRDAELRETRSGPVLSFSVASSTKRGDEEIATWVRCSLFGKRGEAIAKYMVKGKTVCASGSLMLRPYTKDGKEQYSLDMNVSDVKFFDTAKRSAPTREPGDDTDEDGYDPFR